MVLREDQFVPLTGDIDWCVWGGGHGLGCIPLKTVLLSIRTRFLELQIKTQLFFFFFDKGWLFLPIITYFKQF